MKKSITVKEIAQLLGGEVVGDGAVAISGVSGIDEAKPGDIAFVLNERFAEKAASTKAGCVVIPRKLTLALSRPMIKVDHPSVAFSRLIDTFLPDRIPHPRGIHPTAVVAADARLGKDVALGPYVVVESGAAIGDNTRIYPFCYIGHGAKVGSSCIFYPHVMVRDGISIGDRVIIHAGATVGNDGFGYDTLPDGTHVKIPQLGTVVIEDDVEIGSCATVDRARLNRTVIGKGTKIDNLVQVAHNVTVGPHCLVAAQTGIAGSSALGRNVVLGGQVGIADHLTIGDFCVVGGQSGVTKSFPAKTTLFTGYPARPVDKAREVIACIGLLPKLYARVRALEAKIKELEEK